MTVAVPEMAQSASLSLAEQILASMERVRTFLGGGKKAEDQGEAASEAERVRIPLNILVERFELSAFETDMLVLCAAAELDPKLPALLECAQQIAGLRHPTFQLLLNILPTAQWSAFLPQSALRRWRLVEFVRVDALTTSPVRINESVLHFLMGERASDERLDDVLRKVNVPVVLPHSYRQFAEEMIQTWRNDDPKQVAVQLLGNGAKGKAAVAATACAAFNLGLRSMSAESLPTRASEREDYLRVLERDAALNGYAVLIDAEQGGTSIADVVSNFVENFQGVIAVSGAARLNVPSRRVVSVTIDKPTMEEQSSLWQFALGEEGQALNGDLSRLVDQFSLDFVTILQSAERALRSKETSGGALRAHLWNVCLAESRPTLEGLARRIETRAAWANIVLPEGCMEALRTIVFQMRQRNTVLQQWGFAEHSSRGMGTATLFHGASGTGKTLAAEIIANELSLDLFHIDLSQVVSKYIGETEKNLKTIFDVAEDTGAILLFDEADALFGKRSEVRDSHDRYANIEVSYLLQRMEAYRGLAILTTNQRASLDPAFLRRIRYVVQFPYPDAQQRRQIWERIFPEGTPRQGLLFEQLARLNLPGGNIRNIALNAAYIAAEKGEPVRMNHLQMAARQECLKLERPFTDAEIGGWT
jgi:hypothetical protein